MAGNVPLKPKARPTKKAPPQPFKFKRKHLSLALFGFIILLGILTWIPPLRIQKVNIAGQHFVTLPVLQKQLKPYLGKSLMWTWFGDGLRDQLLKKNPQLEKVSVSIRLPGRLKITLKEKAPALLFVDRARTLLVSVDGTVLRRESDQTTIPSVEDLYIVHGVPDSLFEQASVDPEVVQKLVYIMFQVKTFLPGMQFQLDLNQTEGPIEITELNSLELLKDDTLPVIIGAFERLDQKFKLLRLYFDNVVPTLQEATPIEYIDLRIPGKVIVKYGT